MLEELSLEDFIKQSLSSICKAVSLVQDEHEHVAPKTSTATEGDYGRSNIEFDIAVTVSDANSTSQNSSIDGKIGLAIKVVNASIGKDNIKTEQSDSESSKVSRIKFSVPVYFQYNKTEAQKEKSKPLYNPSYSGTSSPYN